MIVDVTKHPHEPAKQVRTVAMDGFCGGHGVLWDAKRNCLWALAYTNLYKLAYSPETTSVKVLKSWDYRPYAGDPYGHDFVPDGKGGFTVDPLCPRTWDYFVLENLRYRGHDVDIRWRRDKGLEVSVDGKPVASRPDLGRLAVSALSRSDHPTVGDLRSSSILSPTFGH